MAQLWYSPYSINAAQVPSTQTDFPVLVSVTDARLKDVAHSGHVNRSDGFDIRPYTDTTLGTAITGYELERYVPTTGELIMRVKVSSLSSSTTPIVLGYGDTGISTDGSSTTTWSNSFLGVYHLSDGTTLNVNSSTGSNNGTNHSATATTGQIDGACNVASASSQYIDCGTAMHPAALTYSCWVNPTSFPNAYNGPIGRNASSVATVILVKSTGKLALFATATSLVSYDGTGSHTLSTATWAHLAMTYDSSAGLVGYVNGASDGTAAANGSLNSNASTVAIGQDPSGSRFFNGKIDEVTISSVARSANWITTEYNNQFAPGTFATLGTEVAVSAGASTSNMFLVM